MALHYIKIPFFYLGHHIVGFGGAKFQFFEAKTKFYSLKFFAQPLKLKRDFRTEVNKWSKNGSENHMFKLKIVSKC